MKRIVNFLLVALVASLAIVSCKKSTVPASKPSGGDQEGGSGSGQVDPQPEEVKLSVDGKFGEWADITPIVGDEESSAILLMKTQTTDAKLYFYIEADAALLETDAYAYANYLTLCLDATGSGSESITYWGEEGGSAYDLSTSIWLMTNGKAIMASWDYGFVGKAKIDGGIYKAEFALTRSTHEAFASKEIYFGAYLTDQAVEDDGGSEVWLDGETIGYAPALGEEMARIK